MEEILAGLNVEFLSYQIMLLVLILVVYSSVFHSQNCNLFSYLKSIFNILFPALLLFHFPYFPVFFFLNIHIMKWLLWQYFYYEKKNKIITCVWRAIVTMRIVFHGHQLNYFSRLNDDLEIFLTIYFFFLNERYINHLNKCDIKDLKIDKQHRNKRNKQIV